MGVIDSLSAGFDLVRRKPWLILIPFLLNLLLWAAPRLSIYELMHASGTQLLALTAGQQVAGLQEFVQLAEQQAARLNLNELLLWRYSGELLSWRTLVETLPVSDLIKRAAPSFIGLPYVAIPDGTLFPGQAARVVVQLSDPLLLLCASLGLPLLGILLAVIYLLPFGHLLRADPVSWRQLPGQLLRYWWRILAVSLLIGLIFVVMVLPMALVVSVLSAVGGPVGILISMPLQFLVYGLMGWMTFYLAFVPAAVLVSNDGVFRSLIDSMRIVHGAFGTVLRLWLIVNVIGFGFGIIWQRMATTSAGALIAIVANAFVGTGLLAAILIFYRERERVLAEQVLAGALRS